jgi:hypothetical protein
MPRPRKGSRASKLAAPKAVETELQNLMDSRHVAGPETSTFSAETLESEGAGAILVGTQIPLQGGDGTFTLICGHRRLTAVQLLVEKKKSKGGTDSEQAKRD